MHVQGAAAGSGRPAGSARAGTPNGSPSKARRKRHLEEGRQVGLVARGAATVQGTCGRRGGTVAAAGRAGLAGRTRACRVSPPAPPKTTNNELRLKKCILTHLGTPSRCPGCRCGKGCVSAVKQTGRSTCWTPLHRSALPPDRCPSLFTSNQMHFISASPVEAPLVQEGHRLGDELRAVGGLDRVGKQVDVRAPGLGY